MEFLTLLRIIDWLRIKINIKHFIQNCIPFFLTIPRLSEYGG